jgi:hypothetical protein
MADDPSIGLEPFETLKDQGAKPRDVYREAGRRGLGKMEAIRVVRGLFQLSFVEAREVSWAVDGYPSYMIPPIESCKELVGVLEEELGYCGCAYYDDAILVLRETLEVARDRRVSGDTKADPPDDTKTDPRPQHLSRSGYGQGRGGSGQPARRAGEAL